jgi:hypothetical protein
MRSMRNYIFSILKRAMITLGTRHSFEDKLSKTKQNKGKNPKKK